jgi:hypothetical protein
MVAAALSWVLACDAALAESREEEKKKSAEWTVRWMAPWDREVSQRERERAAVLWQQAQAHMAAQLAAEMSTPEWKAREAARIAAEKEKWKRDAEELEKMMAPTRAWMEPLHRAAVDDAKVLEALLGEDWEVKAGPNWSDRVIVLTAKFDVLQESYFWREGDPLPEFSDALSRQDLIHRNARPMNYEIRLAYCEPVSKEVYEVNLAECQRAAIARAFTAGSKDGAGDVAAMKSNSGVPRYRSRNCDVYEHHSTTRSGHLFPPAAVRKIGAAKAILREVLQPIPSATDAQAVVR